MVECDVFIPAHVAKTQDNMKNNRLRERSTANRKQGRGAVRLKHKSDTKHADIEDSEMTEKEQQGYMKDPTDKRKSNDHFMRKGRLQWVHSITLQGA